MNDIFLSYSRENKDKAKLLADALSSQGWNVWWDRTIAAGKEFDVAIEEAIEQSRCMIVLWSKHSIESRWVKTEASEGVDRQILVPILIEDVKIPLAFKRLHAASLINWDGDTTSLEFGKLIEDISSIIGLPTVKQDNDRISENTPKENTNNQPVVESENKSNKINLDTRFYILMVVSLVCSYWFREKQDSLAIAFFMVPLFAVAYIGNRYGSKIGLIAGLIAFLPPFIMHLLGSSLGDFSTKGAIGRIRFADGDYAYTIGLAYVLFGSLGFITGLIKEKMHTLSGRYSFISVHETENNNLFWLLLVSYLSALSFKFGIIKIDPAGLYFLIPMYIALRYGLNMTYRYLFLMLPLFVFKIKMGSGYSGLTYLGLTISYSEVILFLLCINLAGYLKLDISPNNKKSSFWFIALMALALLFLFDYVESKTLRYRAENIALPLILLAGALFGPRRGAKFGMIWAGFSLLDYRIGIYSWGIYDMYALVAPVFGYLGGSLLSSKTFLKRGAIILMSFHAYLLISTIFATGSTSSKPGFYTGWTAGVLAGLVSLVVCSLAMKSSTDKKIPESNPESA